MAAIEMCEIDVCLVDTLLLFVITLSSVFYDKHYIVDGFFKTSRISPDIQYVS